MTISAAVLEAMLKAGCSAEQLVAVVRADEEANAGKLAEKREKNRVRQQRHRDRNAMSRITECDERDAPSSSPSPLVPPSQTLPPIIPQSSSPTPEKKRATRLSADWALPAAWGRWALDQGHSEAKIRLEADKFRDFWISKSGKDASKLDWEATWRNWIRNSRSAPVGSQAPPGLGHDGLPRDAQGRVSMADYTSKILQQMENRDDGRTIEGSYERRNGDGAQQAIPFARIENG